MIQPPLLSVILVGRNDNYGGLFLRRLQLCINYFLHGFRSFSSQPELEIIVLDWNSQQPLSEILELTPQAQGTVRFLRVLPDTARRYNPPGMDFHTTLTTNAAIERAHGKYFLFMPGDILLTVYALERLWAILQGRIPVSFNPEDTVMTIKRKIIPLSYRETEMTFGELDRYLTLSHNWLSENFINPGISADVGAILCHREIWKETGGFDERMYGWGKSDSRFGLIAGANHPVYELDGLGVNCYDPSVDPVNLKKKKQLKNAANNISPISANARPGIPDEPVSEERSVRGVADTQTTKQKHRFTPEEAHALFTISPGVLRALLPFHALRILSVLYPLYWFMNIRGANCFCETVSPATQRPSCLPDFALYEEVAPALVSAMNPAVEIFTVFPEVVPNSGVTDHKLIGRQYLNKKSGELSFITCLLRELFPPYQYRHKWHPGFTCATHHGLVHYITGKPQSAFSRIEHRLPPPQKIDLLLFRPEIFPNPKDGFATAVALLSSEGMAVVDDPQRLLLPGMGQDSAFEGTFLAAKKSGLGLYFKSREPALEDEWTRWETCLPKAWSESRLFSHYALSLTLSALCKLRGQ